MITDSVTVDRLLALLAERPLDLPVLAESDWESLYRLAHHHSLTPILAAYLKKRGIIPPSAISEKLRQISRASAMRNLCLFNEVGNILRMLQAAGIPVILLKGVCLAATVYDNIALRPMGDVDLLFRQDDMVQALAIMDSLGYRSTHSFDPDTAQTFLHHLPPLTKPGILTVEMHWTITSPHHPTHFTATDLAQLWTRAQPIAIGNASGLMLSPTDLLLHLCMHASVHHRFDAAGLRNYLDMALVNHHYGDSIDWEQFVSRAKKWGVANGVHLALQLAEEWTNFTCPASVLTALDASPLDQETGQWVRRKILGGSSPALRSNIVRVEGKSNLTSKLDALRSALFPSRDLLTYMYHIPANSWRFWAYYPVRWKDLWYRYRHAMWQVISRNQDVIIPAHQEARLRAYLGWD